MGSGVMRARRAVIVAALVAAAACGSPPSPAPSAAPAVGPIALAVDATDVGRKLYHVRESLPVSAGPLTLVYPKWLPGEHAPTGPITDLVGLTFKVGTRTLEWHRDPVDMFAFHLEVPAGATTLDASFEFLSASGTVGFSSAASATPHLAVVTWNQLVLYPQGVNTDDVRVAPTLVLPAAWKYGTALQTTSTAGPITFAPVSLTMLVDSPVLAGEFFRAVPLDQSDRPIELDLAADSAGALEISPTLVDTLKRLVAEADALFGARHFNSYHFLLSLSDHVAHFGLEHHQSNDSRVYERAIVDDSPALGVLAHEFVHSWNGKFRRPAGLATPNFQEPMHGDLLWVYEGLTQYLGYVLAARSGLWTDAYYHERLAEIAAYLDHLPGREWRPLADTTVAAQLLYAAPPEWAALRRSTDFYDEGWLIWLDVDTRIRQLTNGQKSIDDFCQHFHGAPSTGPAVKPYTLEDVTAALNDVAPADWKTFLSDRVDRTGDHAPLGGLAAGGWSLVYNDTRNDYLKLLESGEQKRTEAGFSIGLRIHDDGLVLDAIPGTPAFDAGIGPGMTIRAVGSRPWSPDTLRAAILAGESSGAPVTLSVDNDGVVKTFSISWRGGLREPHLTRVTSVPDVLAAILSPHRKQ